MLGEYNLTFNGTSTPMIPTHWAPCTLKAKKEKIAPLQKYITYCE